jgi:hypothetical protein
MLSQNCGPSTPLLSSPPPFEVTPLRVTETHVILDPAGKLTVILLVEVLIVPAATETPPVEV